MRQGLVEKQEWLKAAADEVQALQRGEAAEAARVKELEVQVPEALRPPGAVEKAIEAARRRLDLLDAALTEARAKADEASRVHAAAVEALASATEHASKAEERAALAMETFAARIAGSRLRVRGGLSGGQARAARHQHARRRGRSLQDSAVRGAGAGRARSEGQPVHRCSRRRGARRFACRDWTPTSRRRSQEQGKSTERLRRLVAIIEALAALAVRRQRAQAEFGCVAHVSDIVNGAEPARHHAAPLRSRCASRRCARGRLAEAADA